jgi:hypothetical protein
LLVPGGIEKRVDISKFNSHRAALADPPDYTGVGQTAIPIMRRIVETPTSNRLAAPAMETATCRLLRT